MEPSLTESKISRWNLDPLHSELSFRAKHLMITTVTGYFKKFNVTVLTEGEDFSKPVGVELTADVNSVDTNNTQRDDHLKSEDFFHSGQHEQLLFKSTKCELDDAEGTLYGNLTIRGNTHAISLHVVHGGIITDTYGQTKAGFTVTGKISRKEFGLKWNAVTEAGGFVVGDEVKIHAEIQLIRQA